MIAWFRFFLFSQWHMFSVLSTDVIGLVVEWLKPEHVRCLSACNQRFWNQLAYRFIRRISPLTENDVTVGRWQRMISADVHQCNMPIDCPVLARAMFERLAPRSVRWVVPAGAAGRVRPREPPIVLRSHTVQIVLEDPRVIAWLFLRGGVRFATDSVQVLCIEGPLPTLGWLTNDDLGNVVHLALHGLTSPVVEVTALTRLRGLQTLDLRLRTTPNGYVRSFWKNYKAASAPCRCCNISAW